MHKNIYDIIKLKHIVIISLLLLTSIFWNSTKIYSIETTKEASLEQRVADIESYMNNSARVTSSSTPHVESKIPGPGPGHNAWMMTSTLLVLFMTLPGLAIFYGGLVRSKNILSIMAQCMGITGLVTILWWLCGYSLSFSSGSGIEGGSTFLGSISKYAFLKGVDSLPNTNYSPWISHNVFSMFQLMFAVITPALIVGSIAERMKFSSVLLFIALWMFGVYFPVTHMAWGVDGFMNGVWNSKATIKAIDFAGGTVVEMASGWSALVLCIVLGKRNGYGKRAMPPHNLVLTMIGTGMLWVGWYGFNAGSALAADGISSTAFVNTTLAGAVAGFVWPMIEWVLVEKPTVLGFCSGIVSGLVAITPAAGFVSTGDSVFIGILAGIVPLFAVMKLKKWLGYDDTLDVFGIHAVAGTMGMLLTGIFADAAINPALSINLGTFLGKTLWIEQLKAMGITIVIAVTGSFTIAYLVKYTIGLRASDLVEEQGLDIHDHGEEGYADFQIMIR
ncbi:MAG: ammonium transporter [Spirochaetia bacterium]|nr:ammonium transporter [Spirochaetia bacterium]